MEDDRSSTVNAKKRAIREEGEEEEEEEEGKVVGESSNTKSKRLKYDSPHIRTSLLNLPVELLYSIHLYAKNPAFTVLNRHFQDVFSSCPISIKSRYLLARWYEAYCFGFHPIQKSSTSKSANQQQQQHQQRSNSSLPSAPTDDLLEGGSIPELIWPSRLLPVLPTSDFTYPLINSFQRSADHFILDYCLRYPICNHEVLCIIEDRIIASSEFGNIIFVTGLWKDENGHLCNYDTFYGEEKKRDYKKPLHLMVNEMPKRIFRKFVKSPLAEGESEEANRSTSIEDKQFSPLPLYHPFHHLDAHLVRHLQTFGSGPFPTTSSILLFLAIISLHVPTSPTNLGATRPIHSYEGLPLAKSVFAQSRFMVQLLLCLGAEPSRKEDTALYVAIRSGWLEGLVMMVERDEAKIYKWEVALRGVRDWFARSEEQRIGGKNTQIEEKELGVESEEDGEGRQSITVAPKKRRRLLDRARLDSKMLKEAVKYKRWPVVNWIRSKGVAPDLRTIKLIELKQGDST